MLSFPTSAAPLRRTRDDADASGNTDRFRKDAALAIASTVPLSYTPSSTIGVIDMRITDVLRHKGTSVATVGLTTTVAELVDELAARNVGALVVTADEAIVGIVSERDIVRQLRIRGAELLGGVVADIMTSDVVSCAPEDSVDAVAAMMTQRRIRHMPVLVEGKLAGIVSIGDVVLSRIRELESDRAQLESYIARG